MHPVCAGYPAGSCHAPAEHVDHVEAVDGPDDPRFWDPTCHQPLCASCHSRKTATEDGGFGRPG
jgi:5-methylcytosine-specific restriction protein A